MMKNDIQTTVNYTVYYICTIFQIPLPEQEGPSTGSLGSFELMSSKDLAYQMTLYDWELFHCVHEVPQTNDE
jgi:hypothetical protein